MTEQLEGQLDFFDLGIWSGRTYPEPSAQDHQKEQTSQQSSKRSSKSASRMPICVCVSRTADGQRPGVITLKMEPGQLLGEYMTHSFGERPSEENVSRLSQILEGSAHQKYSLSARACEGILRRAQNRGKELPKELKQALEAQSVSRSEPENQGRGKGILIQNEHVGALSTVNNQSVFSIDEKMGQTYIGNDIGNTLGASDYKQPQAVVYENHSQDSRIKQLGNVSESVSAKYGTGGNNQPLVLESNQNHARVLYNGIVNALPAAMGEGGGYTPMVCAVGNGQLSQARLQDKVGALNCMHDQQAVLVFDKEMYKAGANGQGNPIARFDDCAPTLRADSHPSGICVSSVRRLTPLECERLQGFPDGWTDIGEWIDSKGKKHKNSDGPRYKALGNSIAVGYANNQTGFWCWLARRICAQYERQITMASLFDGIGGFPLAFEAAGAKAVWASEIEEFPIAVTKLRFPED